MSLKTILNKQTDFTGEFPAEYAKGGLWRFNEDAPDSDTFLADSSGNGRKAYINNWSGTTASLTNGIFGSYFRMNINNPSSEQTYLKVTNDGTMFSDIGERIIVGGWMRPTTYSVGNTYTPILSTRGGMGQPIFYLSLIRGKPRLMLYNSSGSLILDTSVTPSFNLENAKWYFIAAVIEPDNKKAWYVVGDKESGTVWKSSALTISGELNRSCTTDLIWGMLNSSYWYAGGFDDWFLDCDSTLTADDLMDYFRSAVMANAGDTTGAVDGIAEPRAVTLRASGGVYPTKGVLTTAAAECSLSGTGRVSVTSEYVSGTTAVSLVETSTSDDLITWSDWVAVPADGKLASPNKEYIRFRVTLTTSDTSKTPKLIDIRLYDIPKSPYEKIGYARPVVLDSNGAWEAVLENAYDIIVTGEINGEDTLSFKIPYRDSKRSYIDSEKKIQIVDDIYKVRTVKDTKDTEGNAITEVYAEAEFYDLTFSVRKEERSFEAETAEVPMAYALAGTEWAVGTVNVRTKRTWTSSEKNALSILRNVADLHGGDLVFDCANRLVHLLTVSGKDSGALFAYRKNMKSIQRVVDTRSLVTRLYAVGADGLTFSDINGGKPYVEDFSYTNEIRISTLDCSSFTNPYQMKEYAEMRLAQYAKPTISYNKLDKIVGRERELQRMIQILCRRQKNNPCLIGEPGVGKTAIAEALAQRIADGRVPYRLRDKEVHVVDLTALVAGTQFRGQFESRMKGLIDEVKSLGNIIMVIDEVHSIVGAGDAEGSMNAANILKPALSKGDVQIIGATTLTEYRKYIEKDSALERRFQPIIIEEPSIEDTITILCGIKNYYESFHGIKIPDETLKHAVVLSERYITDRFLPDKAIDLLDEASAYLALNSSCINRLESLKVSLEATKAEKAALETTEETDDLKLSEKYRRLADLKVREINDIKLFNELSAERDKIALSHADLAQVIEIWTGIPASNITEHEFARIDQLDTRLKQRIVGQDAAIESVVRAIKRNRAGVSYKRKPVSFIFAGTTGVGKTELVKTLAADMFNSPESLIRLDMSEFMEKHSVSRIIGSPPGYVGYDEAGQLTEKIRRKPYTVILFDEIEKAHPDVLNVLLQILDDGHITDAHGKQVNFENTVIVMTTNAGSNLNMNTAGFGPSTHTHSEDRTQKALSDFLRPEFLNRIDEIITFRSLDEGDFTAIAHIMLNDLVNVMREKDITVLYSNEASNFIARKSFSAKYGARNMRRYIQTEVEDVIANHIISNYHKKIKSINR